MKKFIKEITKSMQGCFIPKEVDEERLVKEIKDSLNELNFYGSECDKKNMKEDISSFTRDFNRAIKEAKVKFELAI